MNNSKNGKPRQSQSSPEPDLCFRDGKTFLEKSRGTKSEGLFLTVRCHNQMYVQEKIELSSALIFKYLYRVIHSVTKKTDLQCALSKILANLLKNNLLKKYVCNKDQGSAQPKFHISR